MLQLDFEQVAGRPTRGRVVAQRPPLQVVRDFVLPDGTALVHLHNLSGGVVGGDQLEIDLTVQPQARAQLTTTSATRLYRTRQPQQVATQVTTVKVGKEGLLESLADPLIPFAGSRYQQQTRIELAAGAGLFWWEILAPGRKAAGELFQYDLFQANLEIWAEGYPLYLENIRLEPTRRPLNSAAQLGNYHYLASFYLCRVGWEAKKWLALENMLNGLAWQLSEPGQTLWGVSTLVAHGLVVKGLSLKGQTLNQGLPCFWQKAKEVLYNRAAIMPRKVY